MKRNLILVGLVSALAGCGNNATEDPSSASEAATVPPESQQGPAEPPPAATSQSITTIDTGIHPAKVVVKSGVTRKGSALCNIEYIDKEKFTQDISRARTNVTLMGWIGDEISRGAPSQPTLRLVNVDQRSQQWEVPLKLGVSRPDVVTHLQEPGLSEAGFLQKVSLQALPGGKYHLFLAYTSNGVFYTCDNGRHLVVG